MAFKDRLGKLFGFGGDAEAEEIIEEIIEEAFEDSSDEADEAFEEVSEFDIEEHIEDALEEMAEDSIEDVIEEKTEQIIEDNIPSIEEAEIEESTAESEEQSSPGGFFARLKQGLGKTRASINDKLDSVLKMFKKVDDELYEELEEALIMADVGVDTSLYIISELRNKVKEKKITEAEDVKAEIEEIISDILCRDDNALDLSSSPAVIMVIGVNGVGKTTSIGKLAASLKSQGKKVILGAADTFRAAAIDQLGIWADRSGIDIIKHQEGSDPAAVVFDTIAAAKARGADVVILDTAGRLHNKKNLMDELSKISRVIERELPDASKETLLVLDATTGQNAVTQAKLFCESASITGIILTKLDGSAKGGIVLAISHEQNIPVKLIGVGEGIDDLQTFDSESFAKALFAE